MCSMDIDLSPVHVFHGYRFVLVHVFHGYRFVHWLNTLKFSYDIQSSLGLVHLWLPLLHTLACYTIKCKQSHKLCKTSHIYKKLVTYVKINDECKKRPTAYVKKVTTNLYISAFPAFNTAVYINTAVSLECSSHLTLCGVWCDVAV